MKGASTSTWSHMLVSKSVQSVQRTSIMSPVAQVERCTIRCLAQQARPTVSCAVRRTVVVDAPVVRMDLEDLSSSH